MQSYRSLSKISDTCTKNMLHFLIAPELASSYFNDSIGSRSYFLYSDHTLHCVKLTLRALKPKFNKMSVFKTVMPPYCHIDTGNGTVHLLIS